MSEQKEMPSWIVEATSLFDSEIEEPQNPLEVVRKADYDSQSQLIKEKDDRIKELEFQLADRSEKYKIAMDKGVDVLSYKLKEKDAEIARLRDFVNGLADEFEGSRINGSNKLTMMLGEYYHTQAEALAKGEVFGMKIVVDHDMANDRAEFRNDKGELVGVIENIGMAKGDGDE